VRNNLALAYVTLGDFTSAEREFTRAGSASAAAYNMGLAYMSAHRLDEAANAFQKAWEADRTLTSAGERIREINAMRAATR
jgi:tetratricopeptide (TPR) repeat protein